MTRDPRRKREADTRRARREFITAPDEPEPLDDQPQPDPAPWIELIATYRKMLPAHLRGNTPLYTSLPAFHPHDRAPRISTYGHAPQPLTAVAWRREPWEALHPVAEPPLPELLYNGNSANPRETPLLLPASARAAFPELGDAIDRGLQIRRAAGLDT